MRAGVFHFPQICPTPGKVAFPSKAKAKPALRRFKGSYTYQCRCGAIHVSSGGDRG